MVTILGAGGVISNELVALLAGRGESLRLVSRQARRTSGDAEALLADLSDRDQAIRAVADSRLVFLTVGLKYERKEWARIWPRLMANVIEACERAGARLIFFDNVYMYGRVDGPMTEETPFNPCSKKGEIRARVATMLIDAWKAGRLTAMIARSADFYGPNARTGLPNVLVFDPLSKGGTASCLGNDAFPHSSGYVPDAAEALVTLCANETAWNQTWHLPTAPDPPTGKAFITQIAEALGVPARYRVLRKPMVRLLGLFNSDVREIYEMLYQYRAPYLFDSSKFTRTFGVAATPYADGIRATADSTRGTADPSRASLKA